MTNQYYNCPDWRKPSYEGAFGAGSVQVREPRPEPKPEGVGLKKPGRMIISAL
jgi:hypothetical protein